MIEMTYKILIVFYFSLLAFSCVKKKTEYPKDFSFKINEGISEYNSITGEYTRKYIGKDSSVNVLLNKEELQIIYTLIENQNFNDFPEKFECSQYGSFTMPSFSTTLEVTVDGKLKKSINTSYCDSKVQQKMSDNFEKIVLEIRRILDSKKEIKNMRPCDIVFM